MTEIAIDLVNKRILPSRIQTELVERGMEQTTAAALVSKLMRKADLNRRLYRNYTAAMWTGTGGGEGKNIDLALFTRLALLFARRLSTARCPLWGRYETKHERDCESLGMSGAGGRGLGEWRLCCGSVL